VIGQYVCFLACRTAYVCRVMLAAAQRDQRQQQRHQTSSSRVRSYAESAHLNDVISILDSADSTINCCHRTLAVPLDGAVAGVVCDAASVAVVPKAAAAPSPLLLISSTSAAVAAFASWSALYACVTSCSSVSKSHAVSGSCSCSCRYASRAV
jgi:hypothetical protein